MKDLVTQALKNLEELEFPRRRDEDWQYVGLDLLKGEPSKVEHQADKETLCFEAKNPLIFEDGELSSKNPSGDFKLSTLEKVDSNVLDRIKKQLKNKMAGDYFSSQRMSEDTKLNALELSEDSASEKPLHLVFNQKKPKNFAGERLHVSVPKGSSQKLVISFNNLSGLSQQRLSEFFFDLEDGAKLEVFFFCSDMDSAFLLDVLGELKEKSHLSVTCVSRGGKLQRIHQEINFRGSEAVCDLLGAAQISSKNNLHHHIEMNHLAPNCESRQDFKTVLMDSSRSSFAGTVLIKNGAVGSLANQLNKNLLLSDSARVSTKPRMKIYTDDVKCNHGATVGQLEEDEIFYLLTRGLTRPEAESLLKGAFLKELLNSTPFAEKSNELLNYLLIEAKK